MTPGPFTTTARAARAQGLRNRTSRTSVSSKEEDLDATVPLKVMLEGGEEQIIEPDEDEDEDDALFHSYPSVSSSTSGLSGDAQEVADDRAKVDDKDDSDAGHRQERDHTASDGIRRSRAAGSFAELKGRRPLRRRRSSMVAQTTTSVWGGRNLSIIVALASPIGKLLTGSDHFMNFIIILLLVYFLHQVVEVPWTLYRMSIPRHKATEDSKALAELTRLETVYLTLTFVSPFFGSLILHYVASATGRSDSMSWFSTVLFVLVTLVRPFNHLVERLKNRSVALNELLKDEQANGDAANGGARIEDDGIEEELANIRMHLHAIDGRVGDLCDKTDGEARDLAEHVDEIIDTVEIKLRRHRADSGRNNQAQESRVAALEAQVLALNAAVRRGDNASASLNRNALEAQVFFHKLFLSPVLGVAFLWKVINKPFVQVPEHPPIQRRRSSQFSHSPRRTSLASIPEEDHSSTQSECSYHDAMPPSRSSSVILVLLYAICKILLSPVAFALRIAAFLLGLSKPELGVLF